MPRYDYQCHQCYHEFEVQHAIGLTVVKWHCPKCQKVQKVTRLISKIGGVQFEGGGWTKKHYPK